MSSDNVLASDLVTRKLIGSCKAIACLLLLIALPAHAQQAAKVYRIGFLTSSNPSYFKFRMAAFRQGL